MEVKGLKTPEAYLHLEADGLPVPETHLTGGDVLVGKTSPPRFLEESSGGSFLMAQERRESSMLVRHGEKGWVDNVYVTESLDSGRLVRVMVRSHKVPEVGDKFASRHGQKVSLDASWNKRICRSLQMVWFLTSSSTRTPFLPE